MVKLTAAQIAQIQIMQKDGKTDDEIADFYLKTYKNIKITSVKEALNDLRNKVESSDEINNNAEGKPYNKKYEGCSDNIPISLAPRVFWRINFSYTKTEQKKLLSFLTQEKAISPDERKSALKEIVDYISLSISWLASVDITPINKKQRKNINSEIREMEEILQELNGMSDKSKDIEVFRGNKLVKITVNKRREINQRLWPGSIQTEIYKYQSKLRRLNYTSKNTSDAACEEVVNNLVALWIKYTGKIPGRINRRKKGKIISVPSPCLKFIKYAIEHALSHVNRIRRKSVRRSVPPPQELIFKTKLSNTFRNVIRRYAYLSSPMA